MATRPTQTPLEGWEEAYRATPERDAPFTTLSGEPVRPLYTEADLPDLDRVGLPGSPTDSYLTFILAVPFIQGALFSVMNSGTDLARDIETGFLNRMALTPLRGSALLSGLLAGSFVLGVVQAVVYLSVGLIAGAELVTGLAGGLVLVALSVTITVAFGTIGLFAALRFGSGEAVQGLFPVFFVFLFLSAMALPLDLLTTDWFHAIASANPVTYLLEAIRSLLIEGWDVGALALGFGIAVAVGTIGMVAASM